MPEVEGAVAARRLAHVGRQHLPRRGRHLPTAPRRHDVDQQESAAEHEIKFAEHVVLGCWLLGVRWWEEWVLGVGCRVLGEINLSFPKPQYLKPNPPPYPTHNT